MNNKYEQLVEFIINDETDKARELFHTIVVEKSRDIYESLVSEEDLEETMGGNEVEDLVDEVSLDEEGISEEEKSEDHDDMDSMDMGSDEDHHADVGGEEELEDRVVDLESALDELKAEFDALMAGEESEEDAMPGIHGDDDGDVEVMSGDKGADEMSNEEFYEAEEKDEDEDEDKDVDESIVREYVEKVATPANTEGAAVGTGKSVAVNKKSTVAGKNDMGGSAVTSKGGNANQDGNRPVTGEKPKGTLVSNPQNKPGANAGKTAFKTKEASTGSEGKLAGNDGSVAVNKQSPLRKA
jgi:phosphatidate phosphatase PAH1